MIASPRATLRALHAVASPHDRRRFRRVPARLPGRLLDARGREFACSTLDISPGGALLRIEGPPQDGPVVIYLNAIGRVTGEPMRAEPAPGVGAVRFTVPLAKRERIAESLTELINGAPPEREERRRAIRVAGSGPTMVTPDLGPSFPAELLEVSLSGAVLGAPGAARPEIGAWVRVGMTWGRVSRYLQDGFAVDFAPRPPG